MPIYGVIVCPRYREQAQIIEIGAARSTRCQRCNSKLDIRKLRLFFSSEELNEAVSVRTQIQARLHDSNTDLEAVLQGTGIINAFDLAQETEVSMADLADTREPVRRRRNPGHLILDILRTCDGGMEWDVLRSEVSEHGISEEVFEKTLKKLLHSGEVYIPSGERIQLV